MFFINIFKYFIKELFKYKEDNLENYSNLYLAI
jgi:hypothetical protein